MTATDTCPEGDCPTIGVEPVSLEGYERMEDGDGELIVFEATRAAAWVQSDLYVPLDTMR